MQDASTLSTPGAAVARRSKPSRLQRVDDFLGELANDAAQSVRRAGLKPGLERSFGHAPELVGHVIAQEPEPGAELARNGLVVLYVAAPGATVDDQENAERAAAEQPDKERPTRVLDRTEFASDSGAARRRRKTRSHSAPVFDIAPAPRTRNEGAAADWIVGDAGGDEDAHERQDVEPLDILDDEHVIAADALFARDPRVSRRRAIARIGNARSRLTKAPILMRAALALLLLWLLAAGAAILLAHGSSRAHPTPAPAPRTRAIPTSKLPRTPRARSAPRKPPRPPHSRRRRRARPAPIAPVTRAPEMPATSSSPTPPPASTSSSTPAPHHEGGLFSP